MFKLIFKIIINIFEVLSIFAVLGIIIVAIFWPQKITNDVIILMIALCTNNLYFEIRDKRL